MQNRGKKLQTTLMLWNKTNSIFSVVKAEVQKAHRAADQEAGFFLPLTCPAASRHSPSAGRVSAGYTLPSAAVE